MKKKPAQTNKMGAPIILCIAIMASWFFNNYLLFHTIIEFFSILTAFSLYVVGTRTYKFSQNKTLLFLGIAFFFVAIFDSAHMVTYKGMGIFPNLSVNIATQFWIVGRFLEILALCSIPFMLNLSISVRKITIVFSSLSALFFTLIVSGVFPACFQEGIGLTPFKKWMEALIISMGIIALILFQKANLRLEKKITDYIKLSLLAFIASELCFSLYSDINGILNAIGHILKLLSYWIIWNLVLSEGLEKPYGYLFGNIYQKLIRDELTGLFNRTGFLEIANTQLTRAKRYPSSFVLFFLDLDNFKRINDKHGHKEGDLALKEFAQLLTSTFRETDLIARIGGDEFLVLLECEPQMANQLEARFQLAVDKWEHKTPKREGTNVTIGKAIRPAISSEEIEKLINTADTNMLRKKMMKKLSR
jgi:diguanylate cyclase (GGDEF)-like protein